MHPPKIAIIITRGDTIGGAQIHVKEVCLAIRKSGCPLKVYVGSCGRFSEQLEALGIEVQVLNHMRHEISPLQDFRALIELHSALKTYGPNLIAAHSSKAGILARLVGWWVKTPTVFTAHGWAFTEGVSETRRKAFILIERFIALLNSKVICVSDYDKGLALATGVGSSNSLVTIHNGVPECERQFLANPAQSPARLIMVSRLDKPKRPDIVIDCLRSLPNLQLEIVGDGPQWDDLVTKVKTADLSLRVTFSGHCDNVQARLAEAQIFVLISDYEAFPLSILEAMRAGLPVVASDVGGIKEAVLDGVNGFLVAKGDNNGLHEKLRLLSEDPELRLRMGQTGRQMYLNKFTDQNMTSKTLMVYQQLVEPQGYTLSPNEFERRVPVTDAMHT